MDCHRVVAVPGVINLLLCGCGNFLHGRQLEEQGGGAEYYMNTCAEQRNEYARESANLFGRDLL